MTTAEWNELLFEGYVLYFIIVPAIVAVGILAMLILEWRGRR